MNVKSHSKSYKNTENIDDYLSIITARSGKNMQTVKKTLKINDDNIVIPTIKNYDEISKFNYNLSQLKMIAKTYKLKISGNKNQLISRVYSYLYFSSFIIKIQKIFRGLIARKYKNLCNKVVLANILKDRLTFRIGFANGICIYMYYI